MLTREDMVWSLVYAHHYSHGQTLDACEEIAGEAKWHAREAVTRELRNTMTINRGALTNVAPAAPTAHAPVDGPARENT